jgi:hypothetical protein
MKMRMYWKCGAIVVIVLTICVSALAMPVAANGDDWDDWGKGWRGGKWDKDWDDRGKWDKDWYRGGGGYPYPIAYPVAYPVYVPAQFGGDQGACYQACVNSGRYSPAECGQWCYYA